jgi:hypothetical protein
MGLEYMHYIHVVQVDSCTDGNERLEFHVRWDISQVAEQLNSPKGLSSMEFFSYANLFH